MRNRIRILLIEVFQPFAQYRNPFTFYYAQTFPLPPKSTIIGMLQNAVEDWYGNEYGIENWWNLKISVHGGFESIFWNYQQLIKGDLAFSKEGVWVNTNSEIEKRYGKGVFLPVYGEGLKTQRSPIYQQELFNGHLYIFIKAEKEEQTVLLRKIKEALEKPKKVLYLGRSEDIIFVKKVKEIDMNKIEEKEVKKSLWLTFPTYIRLKEFPIINQKFPVYYIPVKIIFKNEQPVKHKSEITKNTKRETMFEPVIYSTPENPIYLDEEKTSTKPIKIERIKIDENVFKIPEQGWL